MTSPKRSWKKSRPKLSGEGCSVWRGGDAWKSGNSLVIRIPKEIADSLKIKRDLPIVIYPSEPKKLIIEVQG